MADSHKSSGDDLLFNKISGGLLGAILLSLVLAYVVGPMLYQPHHLKTDERSYVIDVPDTNIAGAPSEDMIDLSTLMAAADATRGEKTFKQQCASCHAVSETGPGPSTGPRLVNIVGADKGARSDFKYSKALLEIEGFWLYEDLVAFLRNPKTAVKGTQMGFVGFRKKADKAADVVAYLASQTVDAPPLPAPTQQTGAEDIVNEGSDASIEEAETVLEETLPVSPEVSPGPSPIENSDPTEAEDLTTP